MITTNRRLRTVPGRGKNMSNDTDGALYDPALLPRGQDRDGAGAGVGSVHRAPADINESLRVGDLGSKGIAPFSVPLSQR